MQYTIRYQSPLGGVLLACDDAGLTGLWFVGSKHFARGLDETHTAREHPILDEARRWMDIYFFGRDPGFTPPLHLSGSPFQLAVWGLLRQIPYGETTTYGAIAHALAAQKGQAWMSAQAVGGAVGHNPISLIVPCHRVVGSSGSLTGYAGGVDKKRFLLALEGVDMVGLTIPARGTAL